MLYLRIKELRISRGLSQIELAEKLFVTKQTISNWENKNILPSIIMLERLADFFNVTTDYLLGRTDVSYISADGLTPDETLHIAQLINDLKSYKK